VEKHEKLAPRSASPVHEHRLAFKVGKPLLQILLRKPHIVFLKKVEGS
jgi:hypothetical protein